MELNMKAIPKPNAMDAWNWKGSLAELANIPAPFDQLIDVRKINMKDGVVTHIAVDCGKHSRALYPNDWLLHYGDAFFTRSDEAFHKEFDLI